YDNAGNKIETRFFGKNDNPIAHDDGNAGWNANYDWRGNMTEMTYVGTEGQPIMMKWGYASWRADFNDRGTLVHSSYFDARGKPVRVHVTVVEIVPDSQAERLGLQAGDVLVTYDNREVTDIAAFIAGRADEKGSKTHELQVLRDGKTLGFRVVPGMLGATI